MVCRSALEPLQPGENLLPVLRMVRHPAPQAAPFGHLELEEASVPEGDGAVDGPHHAFFNDAVLDAFKGEARAHVLRNALPQVREQGIGRRQVLPLLALGHQQEVLRHAGVHVEIGGLLLVHLEGDGMDARGKGFPLREAGPQDLAHIGLVKNSRHGQALSAAAFTNP